MASSSSAAAPAPPPVLEIGDLEGTLVDQVLSGAFRTFLRAMDGKAKAAPEVKGGIGEDC